MNDDTDLSGGDDASQSNEPVTIGKRDLQQIRKAAKAATDAQTELTGLKRQMAFLQAGVDPADKQLAYFVKGYEGELDPAKIQEAALDAGFRVGNAATQQGQQMEQGQVNNGPAPAEMAAMQRMNNVTQGTGAAASNDQAFAHALATAKNPAEVLEAMSRFGVPTPGMS